MADSIICAVLAPATPTFHDDNLAVNARRARESKTSYAEHALKRWMEAGLGDASRLNELVLHYINLPHDEQMLCMIAMSGVKLSNTMQSRLADLPDDEVQARLLAMKGMTQRQVGAAMEQLRARQAGDE